MALANNLCCQVLKLSAWLCMLMIYLFFFLFQESCQLALLFLTSLLADHTIPTPLRMRSTYSNLSSNVRTSNDFNVCNIGWRRLKCNQIEKDDPFKKLVADCVNQGSAAFEAEMIFYCKVKKKKDSYFLLQFFWLLEILLLLTANFFFHLLLLFILQKNQKLPTPGNRQL